MSNILLVHPSAQIFNIPCVVNLINMMGNMGSRVFFPVIKNDLFEESRVSLSDGIEVLVFPFLQRSRKESFVIWFLGYLTFCFLVARKNRPDVIVAMGSKGLIIGAILSYFWNAQLCFYSLEFPAYPPRTVKDKLHLFVERILSRYVDLILTFCLTSSMCFGTSCSSARLPSTSASVDSAPVAVFLSDLSPQ